MSRVARALALVLVATAAPLAAQRGAIVGTVTDSTTGRPIADARVTVTAEAGGPAAVTGPDGAFRVADLAPGRYRVAVFRIGYRPLTLDAVVVRPAEIRRLTITLAALPFTLDAVVVTASRGRETAFDAPASVSVVPRAEVEERHTLTAVDHLVALPGVDVATTGLTQHEVVTRGFGNVASGALLVLTDYRYASLPSLRINVENFLPLVDDDIDRIEVVRGPGAALYGPNSANGVLHVLTRSPFDAPGTSVSLAGGDRAFFQAAVRHAQQLGPRVGIKLSAQYLRGSDWPSEDPVEVAARAGAIADGADPDTLRIGRRSDLVERVAGGAFVEWRPSAGTALTLSAAGNLALENLDLTPLGAVQVDHWGYGYLQARLTRGRLAGQLFLNQSDAGDTYFLRTGQSVVDRSRLLAFQLQHGLRAGGTTDLTYGLDAQRTVPRTGGTVTGRNEPDDGIDELGAYAQAETRLAPWLRGIAALRVDWHNRLSDPVVSPRAALVVEPAPGHVVRLTANRAFETPTTNNLFLDLFAAPIDAPFPFTVRLVGVPTAGFAFRRDCAGGLCMRSPGTPASLGGPSAYLPIDATLLWDALLDSLGLPPIPAPSAADVATILRQLDIGSGEFAVVGGVADIPPLRPTITTTLELGYKGVIAERIYLAADVYRTKRTDFVGAERVETPSVFLEPVSLAQYLGRFMPPDQAQQLGGTLAMIPLGTVTPDGARDPHDILVTYRNFGDITLWGADLDLTVVLTRELSARLTYSWVSRDLFEAPSATGGSDTIPLNAPANKGALAVAYRDDRRGLSAEVRARAVDAFPAVSGVFAGVVARYAVLDARVGYRLPLAGRRIAVTVSALNVLDDRHQEFPGAPRVGRLVLARLRALF